MLSNSLATPDWELWKRRLRNRHEATEGQTVGLAIGSKLEVFKPLSLVDGIGLGMSSEALIARRRCAKSPNDRSSATGPAGGVAPCSAAVSRL